MAFDVVSDASTHPDCKWAAGSWHFVRQGSAKRRRVAQSFEYMRNGHSYRYEIKTYYHALADANSTLSKPHNISQHMDCESALKRIKGKILKPSHTMENDMDLILAYKKLQDESIHTVRHEWVMGHADSKKDDPKKITRIEAVNIDCDNDANDQVERNDRPPPF